MAQYSADEMEAIIRRALERQGTGEGFTHDDLMSVAAEMGLPPDEVERAAAEVQLERDRDRWQGRAQARRRRRFSARFGFFAVINTALFAIDAMTGSGWWVQWVVLGTGIPLSFHALRLSRPVTEREVERERRREQRRQRYVERALRRRTRERDPAQDVEVIVERGAELLRDVLERSRHRAHRATARPEASSWSSPTRARVDPDSASTPADPEEVESAGHNTRARRRDEP